MSIFIYVCVTKFGLDVCECLFSFGLFVCCRWVFFVRALVLSF